MMIKCIPTHELPLAHAGFENISCKEVFILTAPLDPGIVISLKCNGYINRQNVILKGDKIIKDAWVRQT